MTLRLKSLMVSGFLGYYNEAYMDFENGVTAIIGENGSGKSSLVDAIYYSLAQPQQTLRASRKVDLINRRSSRARILLELEDIVNDKVYSIESILDRKGSSQAVLRINKKVEAVGVKAVREKVAELLGIEKSRLETTISSSVIIRQGGLDNLVYLLSSGENRERIKFFEDVFGLSEYSKAKDSMGEISAVEIKIKGATYTLAPLKNWRRDLEKIRTKLEKEKIDVNERLKEINKEIPMLELSLANLEKEINSLKIKVEELNKLRGKIEELKNNKEKLEKEIKILDKNISEGIKKLNKINEELKSIENIASLSNLAPYVSKYYEIKNNLLHLKGEVEELNNIIKSLEIVINNANVEELYTKLKDELDKLSRLIRVKQKELGTIEGRIEEIKKRRTTLLNEIRKTIEEIKERYGLFFNLEEVIQEKETLLKKVKDIYTKVDKELKTKIDYMQSLVSEKISIEEKVSQLNKSIELLERSKEPKCPLCGANLDQKRKVEIIKRFHDEISENKLKLEELSKNIRKIEAEIEKMQKEKEYLNILIKDLAKNIEELDQLDKKAEELVKIKEADSTKLNSLTKRAEAIEDDINKILDRLYNFKQAVALIKSYDKRLLKDPQKALASLRNRWTELRSNIENLERVLNDIAETIVRTCNVNDIEEAINLIEKSIEAKDKVDELKEKLSKLKEDIARSDALLHEKKSRLKLITSQLNELLEKLKEAEIIEKDYENKISMYKELNEKLGRLREEQRILTEALNDIIKSLKDVENAKFKLEVLSYIREVIFDRIPKLLFLEYLARLEDLASEILSKFDLNYIGISIKIEKNSITILAISRDGVPAPLGSLSGGERTAIGLAFILALNTLLARKVGFLILDEPTSNLDDDRRRILIEILKGFKGGERIPQLIVVTHENDIIEAADTVFEVSRSLRSSIVKPMNDINRSSS